MLTTGLDLLDLSEPVSQAQTKAKKLEAPSKTASLKKKADGADLIGAEAEQRGQQPLRGPETASLDLGEAVPTCLLLLTLALTRGSSTNGIKTMGKGVERVNST